MSEYSANDINDAKRRVEEMRRRARDIVDNTSPQAVDDSVIDNPRQPFNLASIFSSIGVDGVGNDSSIILALILILSREGADSMLILALLYILL